jgi:sugar/nucleoside kinase (ribokinase family)
MTEVLILGGLTVDRFADGALAPGGSVLHSGRAVIDEGARLTTMTVAGDEPAAQGGLASLAEWGTVVRQPSPVTTTYRHEQRDGVRVLRFEARADPIDLARLSGMETPDVALVAPIADEVPADVVERVRTGLRPDRTVILVQGWLRRLVIGDEVDPLPLSALSIAQVHELGLADAIVVSTEDLLEAPGDPFAQAGLLRQRVGARPIVVVTLGTQGYLVDDPGSDRVVAAVPRRIVTGVPAVGAGDAFGAALAVGLARGSGAMEAADRATDRVIATLERRRPAQPA